MKKDIVLVDKDRGVYQITTTDERWYTVQAFDPNTNLPFFKFIPSVTWITSYVYKGIEFYKWLANKGWDEAEAIKSEAGDKGSRVHQAVEKLIAGETVGMAMKFATGNSEDEKELSPDEYNAIVSFSYWFNAVEPEILMNECNVISEKHNFSGTVDFICKIKDQLYIVDFKTSQYIWPSMEAQISAYKQALIEMKTVDGIENAKLAVLQLGYKRNKKCYKFTEFDDKFESLFLPAQKFWENATRGQAPKQIELPIEVKLNIKNKPNGDQQTDPGTRASSPGGVSTDEEQRRETDLHGVREVLLPAKSDPGSEIAGGDGVLQSGRHREVETKVQRSEIRPKLSRRKIPSNRPADPQKA